jgi:hypothetical protein
VWFDNKRSETVEDPQHWPTERMIAEGHDVVSVEELEALADETLRTLAHLCQVNAVGDECVSCQAYVTLLERSMERTTDTLTPPEVPDYQPAAKTEVNHLPGDVFPPLEEDAPFPVPTDTRNASEIPVVERFASHVRTLSLLVDEMLEGPPIPPPNVTLAELGALVVGAKKWVAMIDAQGLELAPNQQQVKAEIERVIEKVQRG